MTQYTRSIRKAAECLRAGGTVAFATETVIGIGADAGNERAVTGIFKAKGRPADNPLIVHLHDVNQIGQVARRLPAAAETLIAACSPGPLSVIVPKAAGLSPLVTAGLDTVAIRFPAHAVAQAFLAACAVPVAAPSANRSGRPSPTTWRAVREDLDGRLDAVLALGRVQHGIESTVVDCSCSPPVLLRAGSVGVERLRELVPRLRLMREGMVGAARSPGMKYRHYAPRAEVRLVTRPEEIDPAVAVRAGYLGLSRPPSVLSFRRRKVFDSLEAYARDLYRLFRNFDDDGVSVIFCQTVPSGGIGLALGDRLARAAAGHPIVRPGSGKSPG